jgi:hypothetical protein
MSADHRPPESIADDASPAPPEGKKPYQKPEFLREQVFETMALACGKVNTTSGACRFIKKNS